MNFRTRTHARGQNQARSWCSAGARTHLGPAPCHASCQGNPCPGDQPGLRGAVRVFGGRCASSKSHFGALREVCAPRTALNDLLSQPRAPCLRVSCPRLGSDPWRPQSEWRLQRPDLSSPAQLLQLTPPTSFRGSPSSLPPFPLPPVLPKSPAFPRAQSRAVRFCSLGLKGCFRLGLLQDRPLPYLSGGPGSPQSSPPPAPSNEPCCFLASSWTVRLLHLLVQLGAEGCRRS